MFADTTRQPDVPPPMGSTRSPLSAGTPAIVGEQADAEGEGRSALRVRLRGAVVLAVCGAVLATAAALAPAGDGFGTHRQLGLPSCEFLSRTGWPCPTCGMTTSVSLAVRGRVVRAWSSQPFGVLLTAALAALAAAGAWQAATGRPVLSAGRQALIVGGLFVAVGLLGGWAWKLAAGAMSGEYPLR